MPRETGLGGLSCEISKDLEKWQTDQLTTGVNLGRVWPMPLAMSPNPSPMRAGLPPKSSMLVLKLAIVRVHNDTGEQEILVQTDLRERLIAKAPFGVKGTLGRVYDRVEADFKAETVKLP